MAAGKPEKALCILQRIAKENNKELPPGKLVAAEKHEVCYSGGTHHCYLPQPRKNSLAQRIFNQRRKAELTRLTIVDLFLCRYREEE